MRFSIRKTSIYLKKNKIRIEIQLPQKVIVDYQYKNKNKNKNIESLCKINKGHRNKEIDNRKTVIV